MYDVSLGANRPWTEKQWEWELWPCEFRCPTGTSYDSSSKSCKEIEGWKCWTANGGTGTVEYNRLNLTSSQKCAAWSSLWDEDFNHVTWEWTWTCTKNWIKAYCWYLQVRNAKCINWVLNGCNLVLPWTNITITQRTWISFETKSVIALTWVTATPGNVRVPFGLDFWWWNTSYSNPSWKKWQCYGQNGGSDIWTDSAVICNKCNSWYTWNTSDWRCYPNNVKVNCTNNPSRPSNSPKYIIWDWSYGVARQSNFTYLQYLWGWQFVRGWVSSPCKYACNFTGNYCDPVAWYTTDCAQSYIWNCIRLANEREHTVITNCNVPVYCDKWNWGTPATCQYECDTLNGFVERNWKCEFDICSNPDLIPAWSVDHWGYCCDDSDCEPTGDKYNDGTNVPKMCSNHMCVECTSPWSTAECLDNRKCGPNYECRSDDGSWVSPLSAPSMPTPNYLPAVRCEDWAVHQNVTPTTFPCVGDHPSEDVAILWTASSDVEGRHWSYQWNSDSLYRCHWKCRSWYEVNDEQTDCIRTAVDCNKVTDNWEDEVIHVGWTDGAQTSDKYEPWVDPSHVSVVSQSEWIKNVYLNMDYEGTKYILFVVDENPQSTKRNLYVTFSYDGWGDFCTGWTTTIEQCPKGYTSEHGQCIAPDIPWASCSICGQTINDGHSITMYSASSVRSPNTCAGVSKDVTCNNWTIWDSNYPYCSCQVTTPTAAICTWWVEPPLTNVEKSSSTPSTDTAWTHVWTSSITWPCQWKCENEGQDNGYDYIWWSCVKCVEGTKEGNTCVIQTECVEWTTWHYDSVNKKYECLRIGNCYDKEGFYKNSMPSYAVQTWENTFPLWEDLSWTCKNSSFAVNSNKCEFSCQEGYWCPKWNYHDRCKKFRCYNWLGGESVWDYAWAKVQRNPTWDTADVEDDYLDTKREYISSESTIDSYIANNRAWCYYWCPEEYLRKDSSWNPKWCYNDPNPSSSSSGSETEEQLYCSYTWWETLYWGRAKTLSRPVAWKTTYVYKTYSDYLTIESDSTSNGKWCYATCKDSTREQLRLSDWVLNYYCWYQCPSTQYMNDRGNCSSCNEWQTPDFGSTAVTANWITNAIKCKNVDCWSDAWYSTITHSCLADTSNWICPDSTWTKCTGTNQNRCIKCVDSSQTPNEVTCKCD